MDYSINYGRELADQIFVEKLRSFKTEDIKGKNIMIELVEILLKHGLHIEEIDSIFREFNELFKKYDVLKESED